jgi:hypothetical protein
MVSGEEESILHINRRGKSGQVGQVVSRFQIEFVRASDCQLQMGLSEKSVEYDGQ